MNQGPGRRMVRRSQEARASRMMLVGDLILGLDSTMMIRALAKVVMRMRPGMTYP